MANPKYTHIHEHTHTSIHARMHARTHARTCTYPTPSLQKGRDHECLAVPPDDLSSLPQTSVIFVFYNEAMSTLLRSIHSVLNKTPPQLLKEILLIDDGSDKPHLGAPLEDYIKHLPKVKLLRQPER